MNDKEMKADKSKFSKPLVIINIEAGSAEDISSDITDMFSSHNLKAPEVKIVSGEALSKMFDALSADDCDLLIVYGGDGTCKSAAIAARRENIPFVPLPGGTMNILSQALYDTQDWHEALSKALSCRSERWLSCGIVGDDLFLVGMIAGDPIILADVRESLREGQVVKAIQKVPEVVGAVSNAETFDYMTDPEQGKKQASLMNIICPVVARDIVPENGLEVSTLKNLDMRHILEIGATALVSGWRDSDYVNIEIVRTVELSGSETFDILLDGEPSNIKAPAIVRLEAEGVKVLAP